MPLPTYMTEQPRIDPVAVLARRIGSFSHAGKIARTGSTIVLQALDCTDAADYRRAIRMACDQADSAAWTVEATVPSVLGDSVKHFEAAGFRLIHETDDQDAGGEHVVLRRTARAHEALRLCA